MFTRKFYGDYCQIQKGVVPFYWFHSESGESVEHGHSQTPKKNLEWYPPGPIPAELKSDAITGYHPFGQRRVQKVALGDVEKPGRSPHKEPSGTRN